MHLILKALKVNLRHSCTEIFFCWIQWVFSTLFYWSPPAQDVVSIFPLSWFSGLDFLPVFFLPPCRVSSDFWLRLVSFRLLNIGVSWGPVHVLTFSYYILFNCHQCQWISNPYFKPELHSELQRYHLDYLQAIPHFQVLEFILNVQKKKKKKWVYHLS